MYNEEAAGYGVTMATGFVLLNVDSENGTPSTALGPKMGMEATSMSRILKSMEEKDLISRKPNPVDGRSVLIRLTPFGIDKRNDAKQAVINFNNSVFNRFSPDELETFFKVIEGINTMILDSKLETEKL